MLEDMGLVKRQRGRGTLVLSTEASPAFVQMVRSPSELFSYPDSSIFRLLSDERIKADKSLAKELGTGDSQALSIKHQMALEQISASPALPHPVR